MCGIHEDARVWVELAGGRAQLKKACDVRANDSVRTPQGYVPVIYVTVTPCWTNYAELHRVGALRVAPQHPVQLDGVWCTPATVAPRAEIVRCRALYAFALASVHVVIADGVPCLGVGGGGTGDAAVDAVCAQPVWNPSFRRRLLGLADPHTGHCDLSLLRAA